MCKYSRVQFLVWNVYTGPVYQNTSDGPAAVDYAGIRGFKSDRRFDVLSQCLDISARVYFTQKAIEQACSKADADSGTLKVFIAPEFLYRGAGGAYLHDLIYGWDGKAAPFSDLPEPYNQDWGGLFGELRNLVASSKYEHWVFVFGTAVSAAFPTHNGHLEDSDLRNATAYNTALIQQGGNDPDRRASTHTTIKQMRSPIDFLQFSEDLAMELGIFANSVLHPETMNNFPTLAEKNAELLARMTVPNAELIQGTARFILPKVRMPSGRPLLFGLEICLDHALPSEDKTLSGRLQRTGLSRVDIQLVPSCGMFLMPRSLYLAPEKGDRSCSYALNCDGLSGLLNGAGPCLPGGHFQLWTQNLQDDGSYSPLPLAGGTAYLYGQQDQTAILPTVPNKIPEYLLKQATAFHLWNSAQPSSIYQPYASRGWGQVTALEPQPLQSATVPPVSLFSAANPFRPRG